MAGAGDKGEFDYVVVLDASGNVVSFSSSGGVSQSDDAAFTPATSSFTPVGGVVTSDAVDSGDGGAFAMLANRQQKVTLYDSSGNELSVGGGTQYTEGDTDASITGTAIMWEDTSDTLRAVSAAKPLPIGDAGGSLTVDAPVGTPAFVRLSDGSNAISTLPVSLASVPSHAVTNAGTFAVQAAGDVASGASDSGNPVKVGGKYNSSQPTITNGQRSDLQVNSSGELLSQVTVLGAAGADGDTNNLGFAVQKGSASVTARKIAVAPFVFNGTDWDRMKGDTSNGVDVDVTRLPALVAGTNAIGKLLPPDIDITTHTNYVKKYYTHAGAVTDGIVWSPASGKRWHIVSMYLQTSAEATITIEDDKSGGDEVVWKGEFADNQGMTINFSEKYPLASGEDAADLIITTSAGNIYVTITGYEI
jgi:hypothetical protein